MKKVVNAVAFVFYKDGKILLERRKKDKKIDAGKLSFPSGIVENETEEEALIREAKEELDVNIKKFKYLGHFIYPKKRINFFVTYFLVTDWEGEIKRKEAAKLRWISLNEYKKINVWLDRLIAQALKFLRKEKYL